MTKPGGADIAAINLWDSGTYHECLGKGGIIPVLKDAWHTNLWLTCVRGRRAVKAMESLEVSECKLQLVVMMLRMVSFLRKAGKQRWDLTCGGAWSYAMEATPERGDKMAVSTLKISLVICFTQHVRGQLTFLRLILPGGRKHSNVAKAFLFDLWLHSHFLAKSMDCIR